MINKDIKNLHFAPPSGHRCVCQRPLGGAKCTSGLAEIAKVLQTTPNYLLGFADNNDGFADEALGLLRDVKDQSVREILLKQIKGIDLKNVLLLSVH